MTRFPFDLMLVTSGGSPADIRRQVTLALCGALPSGRVALQLRAKHLKESELTSLARELRQLTARAYVPLIVNGSLSTAQAVGADGVQLPEDGVAVEVARATLGEHALIGRSCHDLEGLKQAQAHATYATLSPYGPVPGKAEPLTSDRASALCAATTLPVIALGGIGPEQVEDALDSGAHGVAVARAVFGAADPYDATLAVLEALDAARFRPSNPR